MSFEGFPKSGLAFLATLDTKDKAWFDANRRIYDADVVPAAKEFVTELGELLADRISGGIEGQPKTNGSIAPINNDLRFSPDASPYKDHLLFKFWEGPNKKTAPLLYVRLSPLDGVGFASGINIADLDRWRTAIDQHGDSLAVSLDALVSDTDAEVAGQGLKKVPKPYAEDHPHGDLLRHKGFQVRWVKKMPASVSTPAFADWCASELERAHTVHHWLVHHLL